MHPSWQAETGYARTVTGLPSGATIGPFVLERPIGSGATAQVYAARSPDGTAVALKLLERVSTEGQVRFRSEVAALQRVSHPGCVGVVASGEHDGRPWLAMEYVAGQPLTDRVDRLSGTERQLTILQLGVGIAEALAAVHDVGLLHHDLKPANVLVQADDRPVLVDFGFAGEVDRPADVRLAGTLRYMAPERLSDAPTDLRSDLFSLGVLLFEQLARRPPHVEQDRSRLILAQCTDPAPSIGEFAPELPASAVAIVDQLLEKDPAARPRSAWEVVEALRQALGETPREATWRPTLLTGRFEGHKQLLADLMARVDAAEGTTVLLHGPPGIGLSRLLQELHGRVLVRSGQPVRLQGGPQLLFRVLDALAGPLRPAGRRRALLGPDRDLLLAAWPDLARPTEDLLSLARSPTPADLTGAFRGVLERTRAEGPLLITVDDADRSDPRDLRLLQGIGTLVLASHAPERLLLAHDAFAVPPLSRSALAAIATSAIGPTGRQLVWEHAATIAGNPGRLMALARRWTTDERPALPGGDDSGVRVRPWERAVVEAERLLADHSPQEALGILDETGDVAPPSTLASRAALVRARAALQAGDPDGAVAQAGEAIELARTAVERSEARLARANALLRMGSADDLADEARVAAGAARRLGEAGLAIRWEVVAGRALYRAGRLQAGWDILAPYRTRADHGYRASLGVLWTSAQIAIGRCDWTAARQLLLSAREVAGDRAGRRVRAGLRGEVGYLWLRRGAIDKAQTQLERAHHDLAPTGDRELLALVRAWLAEARLLGGDVDDAGRLAAAALETAASARSNLARPAAMRVALRHARASGDAPRLSALLAEAHELLDAHPDDRRLEALLAQAALAHFELGDPRSADQLLARARALPGEDTYERIVVRLAELAIQARSGALRPDDALQLVAEAEANGLDHIARIAVGFTIRWTASTQARSLPQLVRAARASGDRYGACWLAVATEADPSALRQARTLGFVAMAAGRAMPA